jgi:hypothetical protein
MKRIYIHKTVTIRAISVSLFKEEPKQSTTTFSHFATGQQEYSLFRYEVYFKKDLGEEWPLSLIIIKSLRELFSGTKQ